MGSLADDGLCLYIGAWELLGQAHCGMVGLWGGCKSPRPYKP